MLRFKRYYQALCLAAACDLVKETVKKYSLEIGQLYSTIPLTKVSSAYSSQFTQKG